MAKKQKWMSQEYLFDTWHWGKHYAWFKDVDGTHHMLQLDDNNIPILDPSVKSVQTREMVDPIFEVKPIPGLEGHYSATSDGRIISHKWGKDKIKKPSVDRQGYLTVTISMNGNSKGWIKVHYLIALAFIGERPDGLDVCHYDDNKQNNRIENLRYDTRSSNTLDSVRNGTHGNAGKHAEVCKRGHQVTDDNVYLRKNVRLCKTCHLERQRKYRGLKHNAR